MLWIKSLHIVFVTSWFAGLFYLPRILVNLAQEVDGEVDVHALGRRGPGGHACGGPCVLPLVKN